jgi:hypothetical protein
MAIHLNKAAVEHARTLITQGLEVNHDRGHWDAVKPTKDEIVRFLDTHDIPEYSIWFLGIDDAHDEQDPQRYVYPTGDLQIIHLSALLAAESQAQQHEHHTIKQAAHELVQLIQKGS